MAGKHLSLLVHFVWSTAGREPWVGTDWQDDLYGYMGGIVKNKNARLLCAGGMNDHVHLCASLPSTITIADFVSVVKSNSSRWVHETFPQRRAFAWQGGYGAFSVSKSAETSVIRYIRNQQHHHGKRSFKKEFLEFLDKYEIEYDERYLWD
jgi:REP element-mobilizing transposase RayT